MKAKIDMYDYIKVKASAQQMKQQNKKDYICKRKLFANHMSDKVLT